MLSAESWKSYLSECSLGAGKLIFQGSGLILLSQYSSLTLFTVCLVVRNIICKLIILALHRFGIALNINIPPYRRIQ